MESAGPESNRAIAYIGQPAYRHPARCRHSRFLPSFPRKRESRAARLTVVLSDAVPFGIPACAGMTVAINDGLEESKLTVQSISAITLAVADMARSVAFYRDCIGLPLLYGGPDAAFASFRVGEGYLNLTAQSPDFAWWGRAIFYVDDVDALYQRLTALGLTADTAPADAPWGERYFHIKDPDGHELSFARPLSGGGPGG